MLLAVELKRLCAALLKKIHEASVLGGLELGTTG